MIVGSILLLLFELHIVSSQDDLSLYMSDHRDLFFRRLHSRDVAILSVSGSFSYDMRASLYR